MGLNFFHGCFLVLLPFSFVLQGVVWQLASAGKRGRHNVIRGKQLSENAVRGRKGQTKEKAFFTNCPKDWLRYEQHCYKYFEDFLPWYHAEGDCKEFSNKGHLIYIQDEKLMNKLNEMLLPLYISQPIWIGLSSYRKKSRLWRWTDLSTSEYRNWNKTEDDLDHKGKNCVMMVYTGGIKPEPSSIQCISPFLLEGNLIH